MRLYRASFKLHGILIFSSEIRPMITAGEAMGSYISPSPYIHNYPVMYGLLGKPSETYFVFPSLHYLDYEERMSRAPTRRGLQYTSIKKLLEDFKNGRDSFYVFPLAPTRLVVSSFLLSAESWSYVIPTRSPTKNVFPRLTSYTAFMPGSEFETYVVIQGSIKPPRWVRIGKKRWGIFRVDYDEVRVEEVRVERNRVTSIPINYNDARFFGFEARSFSKVLETPNIEEGLIGWAELEECTVIQGTINRDKIEVCLPIRWRD